jgi:hypothetical protein
MQANKGSLMRKVLLFIVILVFTRHCVAQAKAVVPSDTWQPPESLVASANKVCGNPSDGRQYVDCFMAQMTKAGAPSGAVGFTREFYKENHGELAILTRVTRAGKINIAWVVYPLHQPSNYGLFVVNGDPTFVNTEDLKQLDQKGMEQSFQYQDLKNQFPNVALFPGDRDGKTWPNSQSGPDGGLQFIVGYPLRNGCPTCTDAGHALFAWNFNADGKFTGTSFMGLTPAPLTGPVSSPQ